MNLEFHYYAIRFLARRAGFSEAEGEVLAASSQYVDDSLAAYEVEDGLGPGRPYRTMGTQNYLFWDESVSLAVYLPFHFVPGEEGRISRERRDGSSNPYLVTPDSPLAKALLVEALKSHDLFRIGIALHAYADTWAHQHFTGRLEEANALESSSPLPPAGHLQALRKPDDALGLWRDERLLPEFSLVDNRERFLAAARKIYRYLCTYRRRDFEDEDLVSGELEELWTRDGRNLKARLDDFRISLDIGPYERWAWPERAGLEAERDDDDRASGYNKLLWARDELLRRTGMGRGLRRVESGGRFLDSELHRWNEAARAHLGAASRLYAGAGLGHLMDYSDAGGRT